MGLAHEQFISRLNNSNQYYIDGDFEIKGTYTHYNTPILVRDKYGECMVSPKALINGGKPNLRVAVNKAIYFYNKAIDRNKYLKRGEFAIITEFEDSRKPLLVKNEFGVCVMDTSSILKGQRPSIRTAVDKNSYFNNVLEKEFPLFFQSGWEIYSEYRGRHNGILVKCDDIIYKTTPHLLLRGSLPTIQTALNQTEVFIGRLIESLDTSKLELDKVKYVDARTPVILTCKQHGDFEGKPINILKSTGCPVCAEERKGYSLNKWIQNSKKSKLFDGFCLYIMKLDSNGETFYKIGRTFRGVSHRAYDIPYNCSILKKEYGGAKYIFNLENELLKHHSDFKYYPNVDFRGGTECFTSIDWGFVNEITNAKKTI